jgi:hypothetical protein
MAVDVLDICGDTEALEDTDELRLNKGDPVCVIDILGDRDTVLDTLGVREITGEPVCLDDTDTLREVDTEPE